MEASIFIAVTLWLALFVLLPAFRERQARPAEAEAKPASQAA